MPDLFGPTPQEQPGRTIKCLSVRQPWAFAIIHLGKPVENRKWPTKIRGRVLIHASRAPVQDSDMDAVYEFAAREISSLQDECEETGDGFYLRDVPDYGGIVGSVEIVDCVTELPSPWFCGPYGFLLRNPRPLPFTPLRGQLGFFDVPAAAIDGLDF